MPRAKLYSLLFLFVSFFGTHALLFFFLGCGAFRSRTLATAEKKKRNICKEAATSFFSLIRSMRSTYGNNRRDPNGAYIESEGRTFYAAAAAD